MKAVDIQGVHQRIGGMTIAGLEPEFATAIKAVSITARARPPA